MRAFGMGLFSGSWTLVRLPDGTDPMEWAADEKNQAKEPNSEYPEYALTSLLVPSKYVLDAVEMCNRDSEEYYPMFLAKDDAQGVPASAAYGGLYDGGDGTGWGCIRRKVAKTVGDRVYYQDTNNSSNDFEAGPAVVRRDGAGVPSWSPAK